MRRIALLCCCLGMAGCLAPQSQLTRLREENAQLAERIRQDQVRVMNLEEQNRLMSQRLADAERAVATLHEATREATKLR